MILVLICKEEKAETRRDHGGELGGGVEKTRRKVETLRMDEEEELRKKASMGKKALDLARDGWRRLKGLLEGKTLVREGGKLFVEEKGGIGGCAELDDWNEEGGTLELEDQGEALAVEQMSCGSSETVKTASGFDFLAGLDLDERDRDLEEKIEVSRKRKREEDLTELAGGMYGNPGWKWREKEGQGEKRWKMAVVEEVVEDGVGRMKSELKKIPLPEEYKLGLESRGEFLNHSGKMKNNFGMNKRALFPGGGGNLRQQELDLNIHQIGLYCMQG